MYVVKRDGRHESVHFDKITARLKKLSYGLSQDHCDPVLVAQKVCVGVYNGVTTSQLDELAAETASAMTLAARIAVSNLHKNTKKSFSETIKDMYNHFNERSGQKAPLIADDVYEIIVKKYRGPSFVFKACKKSRGRAFRRGPSDAQVSDQDHSRELEKARKRKRERLRNERVEFSWSYLLFFIMF